MTTTAKEPTFRRAVLLMTATSFLVPAAGVITAPVLARGLDADGRGELAAALAPAALMLAVATLGLPDAITYFVAKHPRITQKTVAKGSLATIVLGVLCVGLVAVFRPFLQAGNVELGSLILLGSALTVPSLVVGVLRGAATGLQLWRQIAIERFINVGLRVIGFTALWIAGYLTVQSALLLSCIGPMLSGSIYLPLFFRARHRDESTTGDEAASGTELHDLGHETDLQAGDARRSDSTGPHELYESLELDDEREPAVAEPQSFGAVLSFGRRVWLGSVASMLLDRVPSILMVPLSSTVVLGIYTVANTISDLPLLVALAIAGALYGVNSRATDPGQVTSTARLTLLVGTLGCVVLGGTLPFWITTLFGSDYTEATVPALILIASSLICIPGLMASAGVSAWGRPGLRSLGLAIALVVNLTAFVVLVPLWGVFGACMTSLLTNVVMTTYMVRMAARVMGVRGREFVLIRRADVHRGGHEIRRMVRLVASFARLPFSRS